jgi:hypothetical protein
MHVVLSSPVAGEESTGVVKPENALYQAKRQVGQNAAPYH